MDIKTIFNTYIKDIPISSQLELISMISKNLADHSIPGKKRSLLELENLYGEDWDGTDAQQFVDSLRDEWDHR